MDGSPANPGTATKPTGASGGKTSRTATVTSTEGTLRTSSLCPPRTTVRTRCAV